MTLDHIDPKLVRFWALVDSSIAPALSLPPLAQLFVDFIYWANGWLGGASTAPMFEPIHWFFVCLSGALVSVWVIVRLLRPLGVFALVDGWARVWVSALIVYYVAIENAPGVLLVFVITEMAGAVAQLAAVYRKPTPPVR